MTRTMFAILALLAAGAAHATCIYPRAPDRVPDGKIATHDQMAAAQEVIKRFDEDITAYTACLELEMKALESSGLYDQNRLAELREMHVKKNNAAVDEVQAVADQFNEQLKTFLARDKKD